MEKMADCQDKDPQLIPKVTIDAHAEGLEGLVGPTINKKANDTPESDKSLGLTYPNYQENAQRLFNSLGKSNFWN